MKRIKIVSVLGIALLAMAVSCANSTSNESKKEALNQPQDKKQKSYTPPAIPMMLTSEQERLNFLTTHYWDNFDFRDTTLVGNPAYIEQAFANFIALISKVEYTRTADLLQDMMQRSSVDSSAFETFCSISERYLYDPNSPMRNEEYYIPILEYVIASDRVEELMKLRPKKILEMARKNRVGEQATDFKYTLKGGNTHSLYSIKADYTLVFFNNPDCHDCQRVKDYIKRSKVFGDLVKTKDGSGLVVLSIYPEQDLKLWRRTKYPDFFVNGYDKDCQIEREGLYDLKAMPTLYLLDSRKRVVLKDASVEWVENWLRQNF